MCCCCDVMHWRLDQLFTIKTTKFLYLLELIQGLLVPIHQITLHLKTQHISCKYTLRPLHFPFKLHLDFLGFNFCSFLIGYLIVPSNSMYSQYVCMFTVEIYCRHTILLYIKRVGEFNIGAVSRWGLDLLRLWDRCSGYRTNNSTAERALCVWYERNAACQQMLPTQHDVLWIRMNPGANINSKTKRHHCRLIQCPWWEILLYMKQNLYGFIG